MAWHCLKLLTMKTQDPTPEATPRDAQLLLRRIERRVNVGVFLSKAALPVAGVIIAFAVTFLFSRMLAPEYSLFTLWILAAVPLALVWAWRLCVKKGLFFSEKEVVELVDHLSASDGLASTVYERPGIGGTRAWRAVSSHLDTAALRLQPAWFAWRLMPAMVFAGMVFLVPPRQPKPESVEVMATLTQPLAEKLKMNADVLPEPEREKLEEQLAQVQAAPDGISKENWEAVEDMEQRLENALAQSEASAYQLSSSLNQLAGLVSQQENKAPNVDSAETQADVEALANAIMDQLKNKNVPLSNELSSELMKALSKCKGGNCKSSELSKLLSECEGLSEKLAQGNKEGKNFGRGGVDRGRADAPLVFGSERHLDNAAFDSKQLENQFFEAADLTDIGITPMEPKPNPGMFKPGTVKDFGTQQGTNVSRTQISPSQRGVVSRYFE